jgi:hypothetical protein
VARIQFQINRDSSGKVTVAGSIQRIDPGDEIVMVTGTPGTALQWVADSPFAAPAAGKVFVLQQTNASQHPLRATKSIDMSQNVARCGETDSAGNFTPWSQGAGFPGIGTTN